MLITNAGFKEKDDVKKLGAWWSKNLNKWVVNSPAKYADFERWIDYPDEIVFCNTLSMLGAKMSEYISEDFPNSKKDSKFNEFYSKCTLMKMFYHCMVNDDEGKGIYQSMDIAKKAIAIMMKDDVNLQGNEFDYMKFSTSYEFLMYASLLAKKPKVLRDSVKINTQKKVECNGDTFYLDIAILDNEEQVILGIECDGISVHYSDGEKIANDNNRQNAIESSGIPIRRYTNKQIKESSLKFAKEIWDEIYQ